MPISCVPAASWNSIPTSRAVRGKPAGDVLIAHIGSIQRAVTLSGLAHGVCNFVAEAGDGNRKPRRLAGAAIG